MILADILYARNNYILCRIHYFVNLINCLSSEIKFFNCFIILLLDDLAKSYKKIAEGGRDSFYKGEIAKKIGREVLKNNGEILTNCKAQEIRIGEKSMEIITNKQNFICDYVISTIPLNNLIKKFKPKYIMEYPSAIYLYAHYLYRRKEKFTGLKAILTGSENLTDDKLIDFLISLFLMNGTVQSRNTIISKL